MDLDDNLDLEHLLFLDRRCRTCGEVKNLIEDYYLTRKGRGALPSSYSYECKECTINRVKENKRKTDPFVDWSYPDW